MPACPRSRNAAIGTSRFSSELLLILVVYFSGPAVYGTPSRHSFGRAGPLLVSGDRGVQRLPSVSRRRTSRGARR